MNSVPLLVCGLASLAALPVQAQPLPEKKNWFDDPFFQVAAGLPDCPIPEGPLLTPDEQRQEAHWRAERGTSCWLAGKCRDSNAYRYDQPLAAPVEAALKAVPGVAASSVWVVIQRRWVFLQGCVAAAAMIDLLAQAARAVPDVETVVPMLQVGTLAKPRYELRQP